MIRKLPLRVPAAAGVNVTLRVQLAPTANDVPQLLVCEKSPAFVPDIVILVMVRVAVPVFDSVTARAVLLVPTATEPNESNVGESCTIGANGAELKFTLLTFALLIVMFRLAGVNAYPDLLGVTVYDPFVRPVNM